TTRRTTRRWKRQPASPASPARTPTASSTSTSRRTLRRSRRGTTTTTATSSRPAWGASSTSPSTGWTWPASASGSRRFWLRSPLLRRRRPKPHVQRQEQRAQREGCADDRHDQRGLPERPGALVLGPVVDDIDAHAVGDRLARAVADEDVEEHR